MKNISIFCFGFGQVAKNFIKKLQLENININLNVTTTNKTEQKKVYGLSYNSYFFNGEKYDDQIINKLKVSDHVLVSIPPINGTDVVIKNFSKIIKESNLKWITYLSATSVYGNHNGNWVNEESQTIPTSSNGINRLIAEKSWLNLASKENIPIQIFRLSAIYSEKNNLLVRLKLGNINLINKENQFFSRIYVDDIANILFNSLTNFKTKEIFNISDDKPASTKEILIYGVKLLNIQLPKTFELEDIKNSMLKNFYKDSKKVSNKKMKTFFSYKLKYPTYVEGLSYIRNNFSKL